MRRVIGLDIGTKTMGVAVSDLLKITAQGKENFRYEENNKEQLILKIKELIEEYNPELLVVGMPKHMSGDESETGKYIASVIDLLLNEITITVKYIDERWTSKQATNIMVSGNFSRKQRKEKNDQMAAIIILQTYLDSI